MSTQLSELLKDTGGMTPRDFAGSLGISPVSMNRMLSGRIETPPGVIGDAIQLLEDIDYVGALLTEKPELGLQNISYKVFKLLLDTPNL